MQSDLCHVPKNIVDLPYHNPIQLETLYTLLLAEEIKTSGRNYVCSIFTKILCKHIHHLH